MKKRFLPPCVETETMRMHCITRVVDRAFVLQRKERDMMLAIIRKYEAFCGVRVLAHCCMTNHVHILVEVPPKKKGASVEMSDGVFLSKLKALYSPEAYRDCELMLKALREGAAKSDVAAEAFKAKFTRRMHDFSEFMKGVKQSFSRGFNKTHGRVGVTFKRDDVEGVLKNGGKLSFGEALRCRVRYLSDGLAVGSRDFVDGIFEQSRELFGEKRKTGARVMREVGWKEKESRLYTLRQLRKDVLG